MAAQSGALSPRRLSATAIEEISRPLLLVRVCGSWRASPGPVVKSAPCRFVAHQRPDSSIKVQGRGASIRKKAAECRLRHTSHFPRMPQICPDAWQYRPIGRCQRPLLWKRCDLNAKQTAAQNLLTEPFSPFFMSASTFLITFFAVALAAAPTVSNFDPEPKVAYISLLIFAFCGAWPAFAVFLTSARKYYLTWVAVVVCGLLSGLGFVAGLATVYVHHSFVASIVLGFVVTLSMAAYLPVVFGYKLDG